MSGEKSPRSSYEYQLEELVCRYRKAQTHEHTTLELRIAAEEMASTMYFPIEYSGRPN